MVAMLASFAALDLAGRVRSESGATRLGWIAAGGTVMGLGIWSMHFVGMLAFHLPVPIGYDVPLVMLSVVVAIAASLLALLVISRHELGVRTLVPAGMLMGGAIAGMHYIGMASMRVEASLSYTPSIVVVSVLIAIAASLAALWLAFRFRSDVTARGMLLKIFSAVVMGVAISGMHYTAMAAARFAPGGAFARNVDHILASGQLGEAVVASAILIIVLALIGAVIDRNMQAARAAFSKQLGEQTLELRQSEQRYRELFEDMPVGVYRSTPEGRLIDVNPAMVSMLGYPDRESLLATPATLLYVGPAERRRWSAEKTGEVHVLDLDVRMRRADGAVIWVRDTTHVKRAPDGTVLLYEGVLEDITAHMESIAQLEHQASELAEARDDAIESAARYRLLFDSNPEPMWVYDVESLRFLAVNEAAIRHYGYTRDEFLSMTIKDIRPEAESARLDRVLETVRSATSPTDWRHRRKDGTVIEVEISSDAIELEGRNARLVLAHDVTDRKRLEEQHRQGQKMEAVGQLAGGVAHDFNNILTVILSISELLVDDPGASPEMIEDVKEIRTAAQRAASLTRQLLAFSRQQVLAPQILALNEVVGGMEQMLRRLLGEEIVLRTALAEDLGRVRADPGQLEQVIMNLCVNARDAMPSGGALTMETQNVELNGPDAPGQHSIQPGFYVMLAITDSGVGMSAETRAHMFEPFFTTKGPGVGTGLGLATVYGIVKQSGGHVSVYSEPERGTAFKVYLPRIDQPVEAINLRPKLGALRGTETLFVVEDEESVRRVTTRILRGQGYTVLESSGGLEALEIAKNLDSPIHLLVTDVVMPGMSGRELSNRLGLIISDVKTLFLSGYTDDAIVKHGILEPGIEFLQKPYTVEGLVRKVRMVLDG